MNYQEELKKKTIPVEEAVLKIESGDYVQTYGMGEPSSILSNFGLLKGKRENINFVDFLNYRPYDFYTDPEMQGVVSCNAMFFGRFCAPLQKQGLISYIPAQLEHGIRNRLRYNDRIGHRRLVYTIAVSPMDEHGYFTTGMVGMDNRTLIEKADVVIVEVKPNYPRTFGESLIHISEVDWVVNGEDTLPLLPDAGYTDEDMIIGNYIADLIEDGSTLQLGIGGIPNAVAVALRSKHDLGVHTEMLNDGMVQLYKEGIINNSKKTFYPGQMVTAFTFGNKETYEFINNNPGVLHLAVSMVNNPAFICKNDKMVSVNSTLQVDLMGQCASESIGTMQISGIGGQTETAMGAQAAPGGKSIIALHSTALVKGKDGERQRKSTIISVQPGGQPVSLMRSDIDYVVTEYGVASLLGASLKERAEELIRVAHPDFREQLREEAKRYYLL